MAFQELTPRNGWGIRQKGLCQMHITLPLGKPNPMRLPRQIRMTTLRHTCGALAAVLVLSGCAVFGPSPMPRGSLVEPDDYNQLVPGTSTRSDVVDLMGSPTTKGAFDDNTWIYVSMTTHLVPMDFPHISKQQVVVLKFGEAGTLDSIRTLNRKDAIPVAMVSTTTPTPGTKINVFQQILGNVGRYNPMQNLMGSGAAGGSMGGMGSYNQGPGHFGSGNSL